MFKFDSFQNESGSLKKMLRFCLWPSGQNQFRLISTWKFCHLIVVQGFAVSCSKLKVDWFRLYVKILMPTSDWIKWRIDVVSPCYAQPVSNFLLFFFPKECRERNRFDQTSCTTLVCSQTFQSYKGPNDILTQCEINDLIDWLQAHVLEITVSPLPYLWCCEVTDQHSQVRAPDWRIRR